ncbi:TonB-dependent receptor [Parashewanella tropica]|uniref:TonB-dependent receptor n=1 Tax=Parashewanella tropica TaxID=2547970 RepID=UPI00105A3E43|nr:TonB-dependent receptor [Parashewanella tropica]
MKTKLTPTVVASSLSLIFGSQLALANTPTDNQSNEDVEKIIVTGLRSSIVSSISQKKDSSEVSDVITAEDIGKFPDINVAESLQRIPGIQITRSRGEASGIAIRGLDEVATLLNGRNYFGGSSDVSINRFASFEDIPAELVGSVKVYKSISADLIEGGIGGVVDIQRTDALSLDGFTFAGSVKSHYSELSKKWSPRGSIVTGNVWDLDGEDEKLGVILGVSYLERTFREDQVRVSKFSNITGDFPSGKAPEGAKAIKSLNSSPAWGDRERKVYSLGVDYALDADTKFYFDGGYTDYTSVQKRQEYVWGFNAANIIDADFTGVNAKKPYAKSVKFSDMTFDVLSMIDDRYTKTYDAAVGFETKFDNWAISTEASYIDTDNETAFRNSRIRDNWDKLPVTVNQGGFPNQPPAVDFGDFNVADKGNFNMVQWRHLSRQLSANEKAFKLDADYFFDEGLITSLEAGIRLAKLETIKNTQNNHIFDASGKTYGTTDPLGLVEPSRWNNFMSKYSGAQFFGQYVAINPTYLLSRDAEIRKHYGFGSQSTIQNPKDHFDYSEDVSSLYLKANFDTVISDIYVSGNFGVRYVKTKTTADYFFDTGNKDADNKPIYEDVTDNKDYAEWLPSFNINAELTEEVILRFAGSRTFARPHLGDLAPSLALNYEQGRGSGGNPDLDPFTADSLDLALEYYFEEGGLLSSGLFYKKVDGFLQTIESKETIGGQEFDIRRKRNGGSGTVKGIELAYQQFFTSLPAPFDGLGVQANYTYVDSDVPSPNPELPNIELERLSDNSYNLVAIYEKNDFSGRLSYNYRSDFLVSSTVKQEGFGQLDASFSYQINDQFRVSLDALNLLRRDHLEVRAEDNADPFRWIATEKQLLLGVSYKY